MAIRLVRFEPCRCALEVEKSETSLSQTISDMLGEATSRGCDPVVGPEKRTNRYLLEIQVMTIRDGRSPE